MSGITVPTLPPHAVSPPQGGRPPGMRWQARSVGTRSASLRSASASCLQPRLVIMARGNYALWIGPVIAEGCGAGRSDAGGRAWLQAGRCAGSGAETYQRSGEGVQAPNRPTGGRGRGQAKRRGSKYRLVPSAQSGIDAGTASSTRTNGTTLSGRPCCWMLISMPWASSWER